MCWPVMRLVLAGHDYARIVQSWTLPMVLKANAAMDLQEEVNLLQQKKMLDKSGGDNPFGG